MFRERALGCTVWRCALFAIEVNLDLVLKVGPSSTPVTLGGARKHTGLAIVTGLLVVILMRRCTIHNRLTILFLRGPTLISIRAIFLLDHIDTICYS